MKNRFMLLLVTLALGSSLVACSNKAKKDDLKNYIVTAVPNDIETVDFHKTSRDYMVPLNVFDRLVDIEIEGDSSKLVPSLASSWEISEDGKEYTIKLREGIKFHNGNDFKANDVIYSFTRLVNVKGAVNSDFVSQVVGFDELSEGLTDTFKGIEKIDDYTIKITLKEPYSGFMASLAAAPTSILDEESVSKAQDEFGMSTEHTVGTGAYKFKEWVLNDKIVLEKNDKYFKGEVKNDGAIIKIIPDSETQNIMYRNKELDILDLDFMTDYVPKYKEDFANNLFSIPRVGITYFTFNYNIKPFDNEKVRKAISVAINREEIIENLYNGIASIENGIFPKGLIGYNENIEKIEYNKEYAKELLKEAGYEDGFDMEIALSSSSAGGTVNDVLEVIAEQLKEVGINASVKVYDKSTWLETRKSGTLSSYFATWSADYNDPDNFISTFFGSEENSRLRSINYPNKDIMKRIIDARSIVDNEARIKEYHDLEELLITKERAWTPLFAKEHYFALSENITGFVPNWAGLSDLEFKTIEKIK